MSDNRQQQTDSISQDTLLSSLDNIIEPPIEFRDEVQPELQQPLPQLPQSIPQVQDQDRNYDLEDIAVLQQIANREGIYINLDEISSSLSSSTSPSSSDFSLISSLQTSPEDILPPPTFPPPVPPKFRDVGFMSQSSSNISSGFSDPALTISGGSSSFEIIAPSGILSRRLDVISESELEEQEENIRDTEKQKNKNKKDESKPSTSKLKRFKSESSSSSSSSSGDGSDKTESEGDKEDPKFKKSLIKGSETYPNIIEELEAFVPTRDDKREMSTKF